MKNSFLPTATFELSPEEVYELSKGVILRIEALYHDLASDFDLCPSELEEIDRRITVLESLFDLLEKAYFSVKELSYGFNT